MRTVFKSVLLPLAPAAAAIGFFSAPPEIVPPATLAVVSAAAVSGACRALRWRLQSPVRVLLVGDRVAIAQAASRWQHQERVLPVAAVLVEPDLDEVPDEIMGVPTVTGLASAPAIIDKYKADLVVVSPGPGFTSVDFRRLAWSMEQTNATLGVLGVLDSVAPHRITPGYMQGATVSDVRLPRQTALETTVKKTIDRIGAALLLVLVSPILLAMTIAVRVDSNGKAFFTQTRVGRHGRHFKVYKMRTMVQNAEDTKADLSDANEYDGILFKMKRDPRITRVGALLRKSSLDELPQLINVVRGEMSLVGPRPSLPSEVEVMDSDTCVVLRFVRGSPVSGRSAVAPTSRGSRRPRWTPTTPTTGAWWAIARSWLARSRRSSAPRVPTDRLALQRERLARVTALRPLSVSADDHELSAWLATVAGDLLLEVRGQGLEGRELKDAGDQASHELLMTLLAEHRPDDAVLSEEGKDDKVRLTSSRVWIVDPLDGTREFSEPPRDDWAVHVALWQDGSLVAGAVAQPGMDQTFSTGAPPVVPARTSVRPRIAVSRTRPPAFVEALAAEIDAELVPMGSAGAKVISVARDVTDAYVHAGGQYEWDSAAPVVVAAAAGLHTSRADGAELKYNQDDVLLPDLLVCRPELADSITDFVRRYWAEHPPA